MVCDGQHICQQTCCPSYVVEIIVKTKSCSGCGTGNKEQGLQVQLTGLLGLSECTTDNLDNDDAHDYGSGSVAHFGPDGGLGGCWVSLTDKIYVDDLSLKVDLFQAVESGSVAWTGAGTWTPESEDTVCVDFYGENNLNYCCQLGQALTSADGFKPLSNCHAVWLVYLWQYHIDKKKSWSSINLLEYAIPLDKLARLTVIWICYSRKGRRQCCLNSSTSSASVLVTKNLDSDISAMKRANGDPLVSKSLVFQIFKKRSFFLDFWLFLGPLRLLVTIWFWKAQQH